MKVRRKIMALGTALAMAFVMIASLVMVTDVKADEPTIISKVNLSFTVPKAGTEVTAGDSGQTPKPVVSSTTVGLQKGPDTPGGVYCKSSTDSNAFYGTFEDGKTYYAYVYVNADQGYAFNQTEGGFQFEVSGAKIESFQVEGGMYANAILSFKIGGDDPSEDPTVDPTVDPTTPTEDTSTVTTVTDGSSATIAPAEDGTLSFRIDKPLSYFEDGGELYIDGTLIERSQYTYKEGSTIITLVKELASKLSDGAAHVFKVKFNDGTEVTSNITVGTAAASSAANGTSGTASSTAATTTKVTSPKTADALPIAGIALVFVGATAIGVIAIRRKNS